MHEKNFNKRVDNLKKQENEMIKKHGWVVHYVFSTGANEFNGLANIHTHGLAENYGHPDLQVVIPISPETIHPVLYGIAEDIKRGKVFKPNERSSEVLEGMDVYFAPYQEGEREVLRLILPDANGKLPMEEGCAGVFARQLEVLPED